MSEQLSYYARDLLEQGQDFVIAKVVDTKGSAPRKKGAVMLMRQDGSTIGTVGGGLLEAETEKLCRKTFETREKSRIYEFTLDEQQKGALDMGCGGDATIIDDREEYANPQRYPKAARTIVVDDFDDAFDDIETDEDSYIIIVTRGHRGDLKVLRQALRRPFAYLGMIGSRRKNGLLYDALKQEGVTDEQLEQVHAPIGLEIGSETPEEIAISIVAEIISERARKNRGQ